MKAAYVATLLGGALALTACAPAVLIGGTAAGVYTANDRRPVARQLDDKKLEALVERRLEENFGEQIHVNATAYENVLLLTGEIPTPELRASFQQLVALTPKVRRLVDETRLSPLSSQQWRLNDSAMTAKVKSRLASSAAFHVAHVKVVTEGNDVFLLGRVSRKEADAAIEIARTTTAVNRVVSVFDVVSEEELAAEAASATSGEGSATKADAAAPGK